MPRGNLPCGIFLLICTFLKSARVTYTKGKDFQGAFGMENSISKMRPELVPEWSPKNLPLTPDEVPFGSNKLYWWIRGIKCVCISARNDPEIICVLIKKALRSIHIYIISDNMADIETARRRFEQWRKQR